MYSMERGVLRRCLKVPFFVQKHAYIHTSPSPPVCVNLWRWGATSSPSMLSKEAGEVSKLPQKIEGFERCPVSCMSSGRNHSAFIIDGKLYTYGSNKELQLGRKTDEDFDHTPKQTHFDGNPRIAYVHCGSFHTAAITEEGLLYTWGWGGSTFYGLGGLGIGSKQSVHTPVLNQKLADLNEPVQQVACGRQHTIVLTQSGRVFSTGKGEFGRLGRGRYGDQPYFEQIDYFSMVLQNPPMKSITCGDVFSSALGENGKVWTWGRNDYGQLGLEDSMGDIYSNEIYPKLVGNLDKENQNIIKTSSGGYHMLALSESGLLYFWGGRAWLTPKNIMLNNIHPDNTGVLKLKHIAAGGYMNFYSMIIDENGSLYSWGRPQSDCLARDTKKDTNEPSLVDPSLFNNEKVNDISCGHFRVLATTIAN